MDVTPKVLREVEFREKFRGYDPDEVDEFLGRVAETLKQFHGRLQDAAVQIEAAEARAARSEARSREGSEAEETLRRTLVLAQRTADAAIADAQERAAELLERARAEADVSLGGAREQAAAILEAAQSDAVKLAEARLGEVEEEVVALEGRRTAVRAELTAWEDRAEEARQRLVGLVADLQRLADGPEHAAPEVAAPAPIVVEEGPPGAEEEPAAPVLDGAPNVGDAAVASSDWWSTPAVDRGEVVVDVSPAAFAAEDDGWADDDVAWSDADGPEPSPSEPEPSTQTSWAPPPPPPPSRPAAGAERGAGPSGPPPPRPGADVAWAPPAVRAAAERPADEDERPAPSLRLFFGSDDRSSGGS